MDRLVPPFLAMLGVLLLLSTCGSDDACDVGCALPIWAVQR